jgi:hypothetical protein
MTRNTVIAAFRQDQTMRLRVDNAADAVYLNLTDRPFKESEEVADGIIIDYDDASRSSASKFSMRRKGLTMPRR